MWLFGKNNCILSSRNIEKILDLNFNNAVKKVGGKCRLWMLKKPEIVFSYFRILSTELRKIMSLFLSFTMTTSHFGYGDTLVMRWQMLHRQEVMEYQPRWPYFPQRLIHVLLLSFRTLVEYIRPKSCHFYHFICIIHWY